MRPPLSARMALAAVALLAAAPGQAAARRAPETDRSLGPTSNVGHFLGYPVPEREWHGCRRSDTQWWPTSLISGQPTTSPSSHRYVTFTVNTSQAPAFTWTAKPGYRICGVQAAMQLTNPSVDTDLLAEAVYTSGTLQGSTSTTGREAVQVMIPQRGINRAGFAKFEGRTFSIYAFQAVTVFVRKG